MPGSSILQMFADVAPKRLALIYKLHAADHLIAYLYLVLVLYVCVCNLFTLTRARWPKPWQTPESTKCLQR